MTGTAVGRRTAGVVLSLAILAGCGTAGSHSTSSAAPPAITADRAVPASIADLPLTDQHEATTSLAAYRGKVLVLAPFLTSCQEECPLTTGAFLVIESDLRRAGLAHRVALAELTVDPERDTPARLAAYGTYTGADWSLLTGTSSVIRAFWAHFGIFYSPTPESSPPGIDWQTHRPYTYDVAHSNGFIIFDTQGHQRYLTETLPNLHGRIPPALRRLLVGAGIHNLDHPDPTGAWTIPEALKAIGDVLGQNIPG